VSVLRFFLSTTARNCWVIAVRGWVIGVRGWAIALLDCVSLWGPSGVSIWGVALGLLRLGVSVIEI